MTCCGMPEITFLLLVFVHLLLLGHPGIEQNPSRQLSFILNILFTVNSEQNYSSKKSLFRKGGHQIGIH